MASLKYVCIIYINHDTWFSDFAGGKKRHTKRPARRSSRSSRRGGQNQNQNQNNQGTDEVIGGKGKRRHRRRRSTSKKH